MVTRTGVILSLAVLLVSSVVPHPAPACCPAPPSGKPVVNADQTVLIIWDAAAKTQHFIRQASFKSAADDFGFLVPTPSQPELAESGNEAFPFLGKLTEPEVQKVPRPSGGMGCGCSKSAAPGAAALKDVRVLDEKLVAGFRAVVLEATSADALVRWLKEHGYAFSPAVEAWARPYVAGGWKITALRVAKDKDGPPTETVAASSLRLSFQTDRPLFPYREPDYQGQTAALGASHRLLRIYFIADARYQGELTREVPWMGQVAGYHGAGPLVADGVRGPLAVQGRAGRPVLRPRGGPGARETAADRGVCSGELAHGRYGLCAGGGSGRAAPVAPGSGPAAKSAPVVIG